MKAYLQRIPFLQWIFTIIPMILVVITESHKTFMVGQLRLVDFVDLILTAPFYLLILLWMNKKTFSGRESSKAYFLGLIFIGITLYGHAMHLTANAINTYSTEIHHYLSQIPRDTYQMIYFFDEDLGHYIFLFGMICILGVWNIFETDPGQIKWYDRIPGFLWGISYAIVFIESSHPWLGLVSSLGLIICVIIKSRVTHKNNFNFNWSNFCFSAAWMIIVVEVSYWLILGSFIQPSQLGL